MASIISAGTTSGTALNMTGDTSGQLQLATGASATTALTIDTSQNVGIGTTSPTVKLDVSGTSRYTFNVSNAYTIQTSVNAAISAFADSYYNANQFIWQGSGTERMRIDSSGNVLIGTTTTGSFNATPNGLGVYSTGSQWQVISLKHGTAGNGCLINYATPSTTGFGWDAGVQNSSTNWMFRYNASQISNINSSTGVYTATSDINKKKDFAESNIGLTEVLQLKPTLFRMIVDGNDTPLQLGFIAQEVKKCIPQA